MNDDDTMAIIGVLNLYALALDARRWALFDTIFTDDVSADFGPARATWNGLDDFQQAFAEFHSTLDNHQHTMMTSIVHVDGDTARAISYGTWLLVREAAAGGPRWLGNGWYDDELVRTTRGWRIRNRTVRLLSWTGNPYVSQPVGQQHPEMTTNSLHKFAASGQIRTLNALRQKQPADVKSRSSGGITKTTKENTIVTTNDQMAIVELLNLYGLAVDTRQWNLLDLIFTKDVSADYGPAGASWSELEIFKQALAAFCDTLDSHQHSTMGPVVHVDGDSAQSFSYGAWLLVREGIDGGTQWLGNGWYDDELVRTDNGWRIRSRRVRLSSWTGNPRVSQPVGDQNPDMDTNTLHDYAAAGEIRLLEALKDT